MEIQIHFGNKGQVMESVERPEQGEAAAPHSITLIKNLKSEGKDSAGVSVHARPWDGG